MAETKTLIIDGSKLPSTATTSDADYTYGDFTITISAGAKYQSSSGSKKFADKAILIGKSGKYIYNKTPFNKITKFEIYANKGASDKVSVGVLFSTTAISAYATGKNTYTATLSTLDNVYDCSSKIPEGAKYFWYQVTNANNSQVEFRITYEAASADPSIEAEDELLLEPEDGKGTFEVTWTAMEDMDVNLYTDFACTNEFTGDWFDVELDGDNNVYYVVGANTAKDSRTVYMQLYGLDGEAKEYTKVVTVTQNGAGDGDKITCSKVDVCGKTSYSAWDNDFKGVSGAVYKGTSAGSNNSIQLRSDVSDTKPASGIVSTTSGGIITNVKVEWESSTTSGRTLNVFGSHSPYTAVADLADDSKKGTLLGTIVKGTSTELAISSGDYEYIGIRSNGSAMYLTSVTFVWETPVLNVSFDLNGGTGTQPDKITDFPATLPSTSDFTKTGCRPNGWNTQADGKGTHYADGASFSAPEASVKLYVEWVNVYSVTYKGNSATDGDAPVDGTVYDENSDVIVLGNTGNLVRTGYIWSGWNTQANGEGTTYAPSATFKITANTNLYAKWVAKTTEITLDQQEGTGGSTNVTATYGQAMPTATMPSRTGYDFKGYYDAKTDGTQYYYINGNSARNWNKEDATATLFARWQVQVYTITYRDQNDGAFHGTWPDPDTHPTKHTYGVETQLVNPTRTGYTFDGWFDNKECEGVAITAIAGDAYTASFNIYAKWTANNYEVTFNKNSEKAGGSMEPQPFAFDEQKALTENKFTAPAHKHFAGWAKTSDGAVAYADKANYKLTSEGAELFAVWALNQTTITLDKQGGMGGNSSVTATYDSQMPSAGNVPTKTGYDFNGYYTEANGAGKKYYNADNTSATTWDKDDATLTLYAYWTPKTITITLNKGTHGKADGTATFVYNEKSYKTFTAVEPQKGYTLDGYYTTATGGSLVIKNDGTLGEALNNWIDAEGNWIRSSNGTLYAHYTPINYSVTWLVNGTEWTGKGGSTEAAYDSKIADVPKTLPTTSECDDEKVFMGWTDDEITTPGAKPDVLFTKADNAPTITGETKYYAVFAKAEGATYAYELVTTLTSGKKYIFVSSNTAGNAYAMTAKGLSTSTATNVTADAVEVAIANTTPVTITDENTDLEYAYDGTDFQVVNDNTYYLYINGNGISKRTNKQAYWNENGLYGINNGNTRKYYIYLKTGTPNVFDKMENSSTRVYAFEKQITNYSEYVTECEAEQPKVTIIGGGTFVQGGGIGDLKATATPEGKVTYQWQKSDNSTTGFEDIDGATNSSYTPDNSIVGTLYYHCVVTNRDKSATSNAVSVEIIAQTTCATPSFTITGGGSAFIRETEITMTTTTDEADIYYTLDNTTPSTSSTKYTGPVKITATTTVKAIAAKVNMTNSSPGSATFTKATLQSIAVKKAPTKTEYTAMETFKPAGLIITATYDQSMSEDVAYKDHESEFSFEPSTSLNVTDNTINITWEQKSTTQAITVNPIAMSAPAPSQTANDFTSVTIEWAAVAHADHYEVAWNGGEYETATSPYTKIGLTYSSNYTYKVKVVGATNYGTAETVALNAFTKTREVASIKDVVAPTKTYYVGDQVKNTDITCTIVYNNGDEEQGNPQFVGFATNPTSATTAALTDAQVGTTTIYVKSVNTELTTTITVEETPKHMFVDRVNGNTTIVKEGMGTQYDVPTLTSVVEACTYAPNNNVFKGWIDSEFEGDVITDADLLQETKLTIAGGKTFYAVWAEKQNQTKDIEIFYGWENGTSLSSDWGKSSNSLGQNNTHYYEGSYGATASSAFHLYSKVSYATPKSIEIYTKQVSGNATNYWKVGYASSQDGTSTEIAYLKFNGDYKNQWRKFSADLSSEDYEGKYFVLYKIGTAEAYVDNFKFVYEKTEQVDVNYISDCVAMYELSFDANGAESGKEPEAIMLKEGGKVDLPNSDLTKAYNTFSGWNTATDGKGTHYDVTDEYTMGGAAAVLYADWAPRAVTGLEITTAATTTEFGIGQTFSADGLKVIATYEGGETESNVEFTTNFDGHVFTEQETGTQTVKVSYKGFSADLYTVTVAPAIMVRFYVNGQMIQEKPVFDKKIGAMPNAMTTWKTFTANEARPDLFPVFAGWIIGNNLTANPTFVSDATEIEGDVNVHAVFAHAVTPDLENKTLATSIDPSKRYVIVDGDKYYKGEASNEWGVVDAVAAEIITFYGKSDVYALQQADGNYINTPKINAKEESDHKFYLSEEPVHSFKMVMVTKENVDYYGLQATNTEEYLRNNSSNANCLRWYNNGTPAQLYSVDVTYDQLTLIPYGQVIRNDVKSGTISGVCYKRDIVGHSGAKFYYLSQKASDESYIELTEVTGVLHAGYPYLFEASSNEIRVIFDGEAVAEANNYNGLYGTFVNQELGDGYCIFVNNKYYRTHTGNNNGCYAHRAYLKLDEVNQVTIAPGETEEPATAPRRIRMGGDGVNTPTGFDDILNVNAELIRKLIINDKMYILRAGKMYDATGKFVK